MCQTKKSYVLQYLWFVSLNWDELQLPTDSEQLHAHKSKIFIHIHAGYRHADITSTKYTKVHTGLILKGSRYAATQLEDK